MTRSKPAWIWHVLAALVVIGAFISLLSFLGRLGWPIELFTHFKVQYFWSATALAGLLLLGKRWRWAGAAAALALLHLAGIVPVYWSAATPGLSTGRPLRLLSVNVYIRNRSPQAVFRSIRESDPDVILFMEVDEWWVEQLRQELAAYPHVEARPLDNPFGIALFSRLPFLDAKTTTLGSTWVPTVEARITWQGRPLTLIGTHPLSPRSRAWAFGRDTQLAALARHVQTIGEPVVLIGDLNTTHWSPVFTDLVRATGLRDTRQGIGLQPSWPSGAILLRIPIDHCLVSRELAVRERHIGPHIGSDHYPVFVALAWADELHSATARGAGGDRPATAAPGPTSVPRPPTGRTSVPPATPAPDERTR